jgi:sulfide:quinone oxidoreductase
MTEKPSDEIVVVGAGMAALELVLALRELAGDSAGITVIAPDRDFVAKPLLVAGPLGAADPIRRPLAEIAADVGFELVPATVTALDPERRRVTLRSGGTVPYGTLVLAPGVRRLPAFDDAIHIGDEAGTRALETMRDEIRNGIVSGVAFVAPTLTGWLLPLYEGALLTAEIDERVLVTLVTAEDRPLSLFGETASRIVRDELIAAGITFFGGRRAAVERGAVVLRGEPAQPIEADRIVSLPLVRGPRIPGVPSTGLHGLVPVDGYGRVSGLSDVYAIGDITDFPIKQGGLACQQAVAAATHICARHGVHVTPAPFRPELRATLITARGESIPLGAGGWLPGKLPGRYVGPYLETGAAPASLRA